MGWHSYLCSSTFFNAIINYQTLSSSKSHFTISSFLWGRSPGPSWLRWFSALRATSIRLFIGPSILGLRVWERIRVLHQEIYTEIKKSHKMVLVLLRRVPLSASLATRYLFHSFTFFVFLVWLFSQRQNSILKHYVIRLCPYSPAFYVPKKISGIIFFI